VKNFTLVKRQVFGVLGAERNVALINPPKNQNKYNREERKNRNRKRERKESKERIIL